MTTDRQTKQNNDFTELRRKAELDLRDEKLSISKMSEEDVVKTVHELRVHHVELEMQNKELRKAQLDLEESRNKYSDLFDFAPTGYFVLDKKGNISQVNLTGASMMGIERSFLLDKPFALYVSKEDRDKFYLNRLEVLRTASRRCCDLEMLCKSRGEFYAELLIEPVIDSDGEAAHCRIAVIDISIRKKVEQELITYQNQLRQLSTELSLSEERSRRKFAESVHENIAQNLAIAKLKVESLLGSSASSQEKSAKDEINKLISSTIENIRLLTFELSSPVLYELGFVPAVQLLTEIIQKRHVISIQFNDDGQLKPLAMDIQVLLFHAVKELLTNTVKHAKAKRIKVNIKNHDNHIKIEVSDDGIGFDPLKPSRREDGSSGFGLFHIHESLGYVGGRLEIKSTPGKGTTAILEAPLDIKNKVK